MGKFVENYQHYLMITFKLFLIFIDRIHLLVIIDKKEICHSERAEIIFQFLLTTRMLKYHILLLLIILLSQSTLNHFSNFKLKTINSNTDKI
jgi:hypothetical protein